MSLADGMLWIGGFDPVALSDLQRIDADRLVFGRKGVDGWRLGFDEEPPGPILWQLPAGARYGGAIDRVGLWWAVGIAMVVSALVLLGAITGLDLLARAIPYAWEQKLGDAISGDFGAQACRTAGGQKALDDLARRLSPSDRPIRIGVVNIPVVNAVALPGGRILIFQGLIEKARSPDEVAGVLAHEIGHVENRHVMVALLRRFGLGLLIGSGGTAAEYGQALLDARYSRAAESEADAFSVKQLLQAGISPAATAGFFRRMSKEEAGMGGPLVYLASHPSSDERRRRFEAAAKAGTAFRPALSPPQWAALRSICAGTNPLGDIDLRF
ncbi:M48 family metallopeptidase [Rhizorhabdus sp.]|uniref:M48 family metallopeptidase n=1 Tax=Rhizorhabdus sp. TaxID=1968843 RepID=UPI0035AFB69E